MRRFCGKGWLSLREGVSGIEPREGVRRTGELCQPIVDMMKTWAS